MTNIYVVTVLTHCHDEVSNRQIKFRARQDAEQYLVSVVADAMAMGCKLESAPSPGLRTVTVYPAPGIPGWVYNTRYILEQERTS